MAHRILTSLIALSFFAAAGNMSWADSHDTASPDLELEEQRRAKEKGATEAVETPKKPEFQLADDLDGLFDQLSRTRDERRGKRVSERIWEIWKSSDSKSIDLLTSWAAAAMQGKRFNQALDLLDQVVVLRPDYAEGFNQRATLHYMMRSFDKSIADIERTLALEPRHFGALAGLASMFEQMGQKERALEAWYRALAVYPAMKSGQSAVIRLEEDLAGRGI